MISFSSPVYRASSAKHQFSPREGLPQTIPLDVIGPDILRYRVSHDSENLAGEKWFLTTP